VKRSSVVFLGEVNSTFSRLHYAVLARRCEVVLWLAGRAPNASVGNSRAAFRSFGEMLQRALARAEFEWRSFSALAVLPSYIRIACPIQVMTRGAALVEQLRRLAPDLIISAGMSRLVPPRVLDAARLGAFNCHPSLLPRYAGSNPWFWMLKHGERVGGVTIHKMVAEADAGEIAAQSSFLIPSDANHQWLYNTSSLYSAKLLESCVDSWRQGKVELVPQNLDERTFFRAPRDEDYRIDWRGSADEILNLIRAAHPAPGAWTTLAGRRFTVRRASIVAQRNSVSGQVLALERNGIVIAWQRGALVIHAVEWNGREYHGRREMQALGIRDGVFVE
jgi:methionyl-tRNA formyltransferase